MTQGTSTQTHCPYCALQCAMHLETGPDGRLAARPADFPTNRGGLCRKGWTSAEVLTVPDRLTRPLMRKDRGGALTEVDWDTALDHIAERLLALRAESGPDTVAVFGSGGLTNEKSYTLGKFARLALATSQIDYNGRFCMSSAAAGSTKAFGLDRGMPFPLTDVGQAEVVLLAGANPAETMPPMMGHLSAPTLIVIDPRRSSTARVALDNGGMHLAPRPGTDLALALGLLHAARVQGWTDDDYVDRRTTGFDRAWEHAAAWWPERTEQVTGVPAGRIRAAADLLGQAARNRSAYILSGRGTEQHAKGTDTVSAWINLALALGLPGRQGSGYGCITGQGNGQGGREHGQKADQLPGYRKIADPDDRAHVAGVWGVDPDSLPGPGRSAFELLDALGQSGGPRAMLLFGSNPVVSAPDSERVRSRLASLDFLVAADFVLSETAAMADVVLPVAQWAEESGTMTNLEGRILRRNRATAPPEGVRTDLEVLSALATRLGQPAERFPTDPDTVLAELGRASAGGAADYSGATPERLDGGEALYWPVLAGAAPTPRLFLDAFAHPDGRARFVAVAHRPPAEETDEEYPLLATTGRLMGHYQSGAQTRRVPELRTAEPEVYVEVHPDTAARAGVSAGEWATVSSRRGRTRARVRLDHTARLDTVFLPFHFGGEQSANNITNPALDPTSRMPEFKVSAVRLEPGPRGLRAGALTPPPPARHHPHGPKGRTTRTDPAHTARDAPHPPTWRQKLSTVQGASPRQIVVVGNGMVGARFAEEVARLDPQGQRVHLTVVGTEPHPAYNRVLLSGVVAGDYTPEQIRLPVPETPGVTVRTGLTATALDTEQRTVTLDDGSHLPYDELVMATGARASFPPVRGVSAEDGRPGEGVTALRDLADCDRLLSLVRPGAPVVVLGGGVLGLEAARGLTGRGARVSVVESSPWIMRRQIDKPAAKILGRLYEDLGVSVHSWRVASRWVPGTGLEMDDGRVLPGDVLVVTAGVRGNIELVKDAGIDVEHGILVDDFLSTSDPRVHAIGDCAQHPGGGAGLVQPGWEQAAVLARRLTGAAPQARYNGSSPVTRLKAEGIELTSFGRVHEDDDAPDLETVSVSDPHGGRYAKLVVSQDKVVGAVLLGFPDAAATVSQLHDTGASVPADRLALIQGLPTAAPEQDTAGAPEALVCRCNAVTRTDIEQAWLDGARDRDAIASTTRATTGCGGCVRDVNALLAGLDSSDAAPVS